MNVSSTYDVVKYRCPFYHVPEHGCFITPATCEPFKYLSDELTNDRTVF